jgi:glycerol-3-phosphate dehydrogenase
VVAAGFPALARTLGRNGVINRDVAAATKREFDVAILGGGIHGASLLQQAAHRGLSAILCEAEDFGGATSWNTLRILHGGLRYLQSMNLTRFFQSVRARRRLAQQFPRLVRPLGCLMPLYGRGLKRPFVLRAALIISDTLDRRRNRGLVEALHLPDGRVLDAAATQRAFPMVRTAGLQGAACWSDYFMVSSERMLVERLHDACGRGALACNYVMVDDIAIDGRRTCGLKVRDRLSGESYTIAARQVVNCAGPLVRALARGRGGDGERLFHPSLAFNLLLDISLPESPALAVGAPGTDAPVLFLLPQPGTLLAGTMHLPCADDAVEARPTAAQIQLFLDQLNAAVPGLGATPERVLRVFAGLLPAAAPGSADLAQREALIDHGALGGVHGLYSVSGVKFTTAGEVAARLLTRMGHAERESGPVSELRLSSGTDVMTDSRRLWTLEEAALGATLQRLVREEAVHSLDDLILRRSNWAVAERDLDRLRDRVTQFVGLPLRAAAEADRGRV